MTSHLDQRSDTKSLSQTICVGGDHCYWLEFGTAGKQDATAPYRTEHEGTYNIDPVKAHALAWEEGGVTRFAFHVNHPGIRPHLIYRGVRSEILNYAIMTLGSALETDGVTVNAMETALREDIMPFAVRRMGEQLDAQAPGVKEQNPFSGKGASSKTSSAGQNLGKKIEG